MSDARELLEQYERERTRWSRTAEADVLEAPRVFAALRAVLTWHQPQKRWHDGSGEWSVEAPDDLNNPEYFEVCRHCGELEVSDQAPDVHYRDSLWPCNTVHEILTALRGEPNE